MRLLICLMLAGCGDLPAPSVDVIEDVAPEAASVECLQDSDCFGVGTLSQRYCQECMCVEYATHHAPCYLLGGYE